MKIKIPKIDLDFLKEKKKPLHVAINASRISDWSDDNKKAAEKNIEQIDKFIKYQIKAEIPVFTINIATKTEETISSLVKYFTELVESNFLAENQIRVFVIGDWYELDQDLTDIFKKIMDLTKDFDKSFLNIGVNYDGQKEVLGVIKLLAQKAKLGKVTLEELDTDMVKENLYTSYFTPPDIIIESSKIYSGLLLWDSKGAKIFQTRKHWLDFSTDIVDDAITWSNRE